MVTVKVLLTLVVSKSWPLIQLDVNNAFLHGDLAKEVYMDLTLGYKPNVMDHSTRSRLVCRLNKSIYSLKQASRQWFSKFSTTLLQLGFQQSKSDYSVFVRRSSGTLIALLVYVDDIILTGANVSLIRSLQSLLNN